MIKLNEDDDFGFSLVSESELKSIEETLSKQLEEKERLAKETSSQLELTTTQMQTKMEGLVRMIMPLLNNLMTDPSKEYIYWPDRADKIKKFKAKIEAYIKQ
jgi:hypothetical protein